MSVVLRSQIAYATTTTGSSWTNPQYAQYGPGNTLYAQVGPVSQAPNLSTGNLHGANFSFSISSGAVIKGFGVQAGTAAFDYASQGSYNITCALNGVPFGTSGSYVVNAPAYPPTNFPELGVGGPAVLNGLNLTAAQVNTAGFMNCDMSMFLSGGSGVNDGLFCNYLTVTVYFVIPTPPQFFFGTSV